MTVLDQAYILLVIFQATHEVTSLRCYQSYGRESYGTPETEACRLGVKWCIKEYKEALETVDYGRTYEETGDDTWGTLPQGQDRESHRTLSKSQFYRDFAKNDEIDGQVIPPEILDNGELPSGTLGSRDPYRRDQGYDDRDYPRNPSSGYNDRDYPRNSHNAYNDRTYYDRDRNHRDPYERSRYANDAYESPRNTRVTKGCFEGADAFVREGCVVREDAGIRVTTCYCRDEYCNESSIARNMAGLTAVLVLLLSFVL
eukprot:maker-scaffold2181_size19268-snap-gene-0.5 protein:Tk09772 transcript:maker-scaffold2181_size19268-snap-gene-0.5-mRNA-1 annotation:"zinc finger protein 521-like isoform x2"